VVAALTELAAKGVVSADVITKAIKEMGINPDKPNPLLV
jgi:pyruvate dehydrogenase E1 component